jgi:hypothetical protein
MNRRKSPPAANKLVAKPSRLKVKLSSLRSIGLLGLVWFVLLLFRTSNDANYVYLICTIMIIYGGVLMLYHKKVSEQVLNNIRLVFR